MTIQQATREELVLLQNNDVPVTVTLTLTDDVGAPVPNWDQVTVELITEAAGMIAIYSSAGADPLLQKQTQLAPTDPTEIIVLFPRGRLAAPVTGSFVIDVIDPTVPADINDESRLTYRYGPFRIRRTRRNGTLTGWATDSILAAIEAAVDAAFAAAAVGAGEIDGNDDGYVIDGGP